MLELIKSMTVVKFQDLEEALRLERRRHELAEKARWLKIVNSIDTELENTNDHQVKLVLSTLKISILKGIKECPNSPKQL